MLPILVKNKPTFHVLLLNSTSKFTFKKFHMNFFSLCSPGLSCTHYIAQSVIKLAEILLPYAPKCWEQAYVITYGSA